VTSTPSGIEIQVAVLPEFKKQAVLQEFPGFGRLYPQLNVQRGSPEAASCFTRFRGRPLGSVKNQRANERIAWTSSADKNIDPQVNWG
jgi:hypothetical protein